MPPRPESIPHSADDLRPSGSPVVTVVTPVLNGMPTLRDTIASVLEQTFADFEYVIADGGSTDGSQELGRATAASDSRVRFVSQADRGIYDAIVNSFSKARGRIFVWVNADDKLFPWSLQTVVDAIDAKGEHWVIGIQSYWDLAGRLAWVDQYRFYSNVLIRRGWHQANLLGALQLESMAFTRELWMRVPPEKLEAVRGMKLAGDFVLWTEFARHAQLRALPTVIGGFRYHEANRSAAQASYWDEVRQAGFRVMPRWVRPLAFPVRLCLSAIAYGRRRAAWRQLLTRLRPSQHQEFN